VIPEPTAPAPAAPVERDESRGPSGAGNEAVEPALPTYFRGVMEDACFARFFGATRNPDPYCLAGTAAPAPAPAPAAPTQLVAGPPSAQTVAVDFWRTIPLPVPRPAIPPGYAITGKAAYLVTHGTTSPPGYVDNTPLGRLTILATGQYLVDWGDGSAPEWNGPYRSEGTAWPNGTITHTYDFVGTYTVTVEEDWTATWQLDGQGGVLAGLRTTATIPGLRAEQLQAVITY
jgi:hypothetical protein